MMYNELVRAFVQVTLKMEGCKVQAGLFPNFIAKTIIPCIISSHSEIMYFSTYNQGCILQ